MLLSAVLFQGTAFSQVHQPINWKFASLAGKNGEATLKFTANLDPGWHLYSQFMEKDGPLPTTFAFRENDDYTRIGSVTEETQSLKTFDETFQMGLAWFKDSAVFLQKVRLDTAEATISGIIEFMLCTDEMCLPPDEISFAIKTTTVFPTKGPVKTTVQPGSPDETHGRPGRRTRSDVKPNMTGGADVKPETRLGCGVKGAETAGVDVKPDFDAETNVKPYLRTKTNMTPQQSQDFDLHSARGVSQNAPALPANRAGLGRKYSDLFQAPFGLDAFFDYEEGLAYARKVNKPVMLDFTGHACVNCRKMETVVWSDPRLLGKLRRDYVVVQLYVDDKTGLNGGEEFISSYSGKKVTTIGNKWSDLQAARFNTNAQPYYVLLDGEGVMLTRPRGAEYDVESFTVFLDEGLDRFRGRVPI